MSAFWAVHVCANSGEILEPVEGWSICEDAQDTTSPENVTTSRREEGISRDPKPSCRRGCAYYSVLRGVNACFSCRYTGKLRMDFHLVLLVCQVDYLQASILQVVKPPSAIGILRWNHVLACSEAAVTWCCVVHARCDTWNIGIYILRVWGVCNPIIQSKWLHYSAVWFLYRQLTVHLHKTRTTKNKGLLRSFRVSSDGTLAVVLKLFVTSKYGYE